MTTDHRPPILNNKDHRLPSIFTPENLLREARRQKAVPAGSIPSICILDPDGDIVQYLLDTGQATCNPYWACYHTKLYNLTCGDLEYGIIGGAVGASFAVLAAEELFSSGCQLLISITSAGQITPTANPPYFILIDRALRDEGTSYHYLPPAPYSRLNPRLLTLFDNTFEHLDVRVIHGRRVKTSPARAHSSLGATVIEIATDTWAGQGRLYSKKGQFYGGCSGKLHLREKYAEIEYFNPTR